MTPEELRQCLENAFGGMEPPFFAELSSSVCFDLGFENAVRMDTARAKRWQELRGLSGYLPDALALFGLTPKACRYYLPAYLYVMTGAESIWCYLSAVLTTLWYEDDDGELRFNNPHVRGRWEELTSLLTDRQKRCIAHWLVEVLKITNDPSIEGHEELNMESDRIDLMLKKYWNAWL